MVAILGWNGKLVEDNIVEFGFAKNKKLSEVLWLDHNSEEGLHCDTETKGGHPIKSKIGFGESNATHEAYEGKRFRLPSTSNNARNWSSSDEENTTTCGKNENFREATYRRLITNYNQLQQHDSNIAYNDIGKCYIPFPPSSEIQIEVRHAMEPHYCTLESH